MWISGTNNEAQFPLSLKIQMNWIEARKFIFIAFRFITERYSADELFWKLKPEALVLFSELF